MTTRRTSRQLSSFLLRVREERSERRVLRYELHDLHSGITLHFASLALLQRHLRAAEATGAVDVDLAAPADSSANPLAGSSAADGDRRRLRRK